MFIYDTVFKNDEEIRAFVSEAEEKYKTQILKIADHIKNTPDVKFLTLAALNHKPGNHAVKAQTVVEAVLHKPHKILHRFGRVLAKQLEVDFPAVRQRYTNFVLCHCHSPRGSRAADFSESPLQ